VSAFPVILELCTEAVAAQSQDGVGAAHGPEHPRLHTVESDFGPRRHKGNTGQLYPQVELCRLPIACFPNDIHPLRLQDCLRQWSHQAVLDQWGRSPEGKCEDGEPKAPRFGVYIGCKAGQELCRFPERSETGRPAAPRNTFSRDGQPYPMLTLATPLECAHTEFRAVSPAESALTKSLDLMSFTINSYGKTRGEGEICPVGNMPIPLSCRAIQWPIFLLPVDHCRTPALSLPDRFRVF